MPTAYKFGPYRLDAQAEILFRGGEPVALGQRAVALLRVLVERAGAPVSKDALIEAAWPGLAVEESNLTVQIAALRRVFAEEPARHARWIETLSRRGYRYVGPAVAIEEDSPTAAAKAQLAPTLELPDKPSIAVLPFTNMSGDPEQGYFADGIVDDVITELSRFSELFVIARNSSFQYKGNPVDVRQIGRELGVRYVLEGSIRRDGDRVRIGAQLIDASTGAHRWAERYERKLDDVFAVQDEVARAITAISGRPCEQGRGRTYVAEASSELAGLRQLHASLRRLRIVSVLVQSKRPVRDAALPRALSVDRRRLCSGLCRAFSDPHDRLGKPFGWRPSEFCRARPRISNGQ